MHYDHAYPATQNKLDIVIYRHEYSGEHTASGVNETTLEITSIQDCRFIRPKSLQDFLNSYRFHLAEVVRDLKVEEFYLICLKEEIEANAPTFKVVSVELVTKDHADIFALH